MGVTGMVFPMLLLLISAFGKIYPTNEGRVETGLKID